MQNKNTRFTRKPLHPRVTLKDMLQTTALCFSVLLFCTYILYADLSLRIQLTNALEELEQYNVADEIVIEEKESYEEEEIEEIVEQIQEVVNTIPETAPQPIPKPFDIDKLAYAVSMAETSGFTKGYGVTHNNGQGIKHGNTVPCPGVPKLAMCKFNTINESNEAFKTIWSKWYGEMPNRAMAVKWTGNDRADNWLRIVKFYYYQ